MEEVLLVDVTTVARLDRRAPARTSRRNKDHLTHLDSAIGDADHGINLVRGFSAVRDGARREAARDPRRAAHPGRQHADLQGRRRVRPAVRHRLPAGRQGARDRAGRGTRGTGPGAAGGARRGPGPRGRGRGRQDDGRRARAGGPRVPARAGHRRRPSRTPPRPPRRRPSRGPRRPSRCRRSRAGPATWARAASGTRTRAPPRRHCSSPRSLRRWPGRGRDHGVRGGGLLPGEVVAPGWRPAEPVRRRGARGHGHRGRGQGRLRGRRARLDDLAGSLRRDGATASADILATEALIARDPAFVDEAVGLLSGPDASPPATP